MNEKITTIKQFINAYDVYLKIKELKELNIYVEETDHYEGLLIEMLDFLGTTTIEIEKQLIKEKPEYIAIASVRSDLLKALDEYQEYHEED